MAAAKTGADSGRRALEILLSFTEQRPLLTVRQLAEDLDIPVPSVHRYVALLRDMGLLEERGRGQYHLTMRVAALSRAARQATPLVDLAEPFMRELVGQTGESALLVRLVHNRPVCMHRVESAQRFRLSFEIGQHLPPLRGASARLLVASLDPADRERYVDQALAEGARPPLKGRERFLSDAERDAARGWSVSNQEIDDGIWAAAAPITEGGRTVASLSAPCPAFRLDKAKREAIIDLVRKSAADISHALGA
ncbi:IclR family transcriptional regulator [Saccharopolyspora sp. NPDC000359]|uniref:IclR family transcriptional regulator n=1 Tax=Saccharopolyspora sp. NPDC000359 TaxID=3154251 RepID=UPI003325C8EC